MSKATPLNLTLDADPQQIIFAGRGATEASFTLTNNDTRNAASVLLNVVRGDLLPKSALSLTTEELTGGGYKIIDEKWVECRLASPDAWQPIDDWATPFDIGALAAGASVSFEMRVNVPTADTSAGRMCFALMISALAGDDLHVTSVTIDQDDFAVDIGDTTTATATVVADAGLDDSVVWMSSDTDVAAIDISTGVITGIGAGAAIITANANANCSIKSSRFAVISAPSIVAGSKAWYAADDATTITESGGLVSKWADKSGNGYDLTENTKKPTTGAETLNNLNVISFGGSQQLLGPDAAVPAGATDYTIFAVWLANGAMQTLFHMGGNSTNLAVGAHIHATSANDLRHFWWNNDFDSGLNTFATGAAHVTTLQWDSATGKQLTRIDTTEYSRTASGKNTTGSNFAVGTIPIYPVHSLTGYIAELIIYHTALTPAEIAFNEAYLKAKWGL